MQQRQCAPFAGSHRTIYAMIAEQNSRFVAVQSDHDHIIIIIIIIVIITVSTILTIHDLPSISQNNRSITDINNSALHSAILTPIATSSLVSGSTRAL